MWLQGQAGMRMGDPLHAPAQGVLGNTPQNLLVTPGTCLLIGIICLWSRPWRVLVQPHSEDGL